MFDRHLEIDCEFEAEDRDAHVFLSLGDMMSGVLMIFALLFVTVLVQLKEREEPRRIVVGTVMEALAAKNIDVAVNPETGDISIRDSVLFDFNSAELKPEGKQFLQAFIPVYSKTIFSNPKFEREITRVVIEGHTSSQGSYDENLELSLLRSYAVSEFIFSEAMTFDTQTALSQKVMASGRGEIDARQDGDDPTDRKVIFRFQFRNHDFSDWSLQNP